MGGCFSFLERWNSCATLIQKLHDGRIRSLYVPPCRGWYVTGRLPTASLDSSQRDMSRDKECPLLAVPQMARTLSVPRITALYTVYGTHTRGHRPAEEEALPSPNAREPSISSGHGPGFAPLGIDSGNRPATWRCCRWSRTYGARARSLKGDLAEASPYDDSDLRSPPSMSLATARDESSQSA